MDRELPKSVVLKRRLSLAIRVGMALAAVAAMAVLAIRLSTASVSLNSIMVSVVDSGSVEVSFAAAGRVVPAYEEAVISPISSQIVKMSCLAGDSVVKGKKLMVIDTDKLLFEYQRLKSEYQQAQNSHSKHKIEIERKEQDATLQHSKLMLKIDALRAEFENEQYLLSIKGTSKDRVAKLGMELSIAELELESSKKQLCFSKQLVDIELESLGIDLTVQAGKLKEMEVLLNRAQLEAPISGTVSFINSKAGSAVSAGEVVARISDLSTYRVDGVIADSYASRLIVGQGVAIRLGREELIGHIANIAPGVQEGVLTFSVTLTDGANPILRPNMRAELRVIAQQVNNTLRIGTGEYYSGPGEYNLFVISQGEATKRRVKLGGCSFSHVEVISGLSQNETVIISKLNGLEKVEKIRID